VLLLQCFIYEFSKEIESSDKISGLNFLQFLQRCDKTHKTFLNQSPIFCRDCIIIILLGSSNNILSMLGLKNVCAVEASDVTPLDIHLFDQIAITSSILSLFPF
jgi:hypothetical protein